MGVEYLGQVNGIITAEKLVSEIKLDAEKPNDNGDITWLKFKDEGKVILIANRGILNNLNYTELISDTGEEPLPVTSPYIYADYRLFSSEEWDKYIVEHTPDDSISNWSQGYFFTSSLSNGDNVITRGKDSPSGSKLYSKGTSGIGIYWRPLLEITGRNYIISLDEYLGYNFYPIVKSYTVDVFEHSYYSIVEKLNGNTIKNLTDQPKDQEQLLDLTAYWESLPYGKNTIEITITDIDGFSYVKTITFDKMKESIEPIPTTSSLKSLVNQIGNINEHIEYFKIRLIRELGKKGLECSDTNKISSLIDSISRLEVLGTLIPGDTNTLFSIEERLSVRAPSDFIEVATYTHTIVKGKVKMSFNLSSSYSSTTAYSQVYKRTSNGVTTLLGEFSTKGASNLLCELDIDIEPGDTIYWMLRPGSSSSYLAYMENLKISYDRPII